MKADAPHTALVDESFRRGSDGKGCFVMVAAIVPDEHHAEITARLRTLVSPGQRRWHFRDEGPTSRRTFLARTAELHELDVVALAFCCQTPSQRKSEQARVRCIWNLLAELRERDGVQTVVFESRQEHNDRKDRREVIGAQRAGVAAANLVYHHGRPKEEPLLWLADAIAGAVGTSVASHDHELAGLLPESMRQVRWIGPGTA